MAMAIFSLTKMGQCSKAFSVFRTPTKVNATSLTPEHLALMKSITDCFHPLFASEGAQLYKNWIIKQYSSYTHFFFFVCQSKKKKKIQLEFVFLH